MAANGSPAGQDGLHLTQIAPSPAGNRWRTEAMRSHRTPRLLYLSRGQGRITIAGLTSGFGPNNLIFVPAGTMHGFEVGPQTFGLMLTIPPAMAAEWPEEAVHLRLKDVVAQKELATLFDGLERELKSARPGGLRAAHYHVGLLAVFFQRQMDSQAAPRDDRSRSAAARLVAAYTDLVERDYRRGLGVADYARALGVTPTHLSRCCRTTCGRSALALLNDRIAYEARVLLRETKVPIRDIAQSLGFGSAAYFTRSFQARAGMTPSAFRRSGAAPLP